MCFIGGGLTIFQFLGLVLWFFMPVGGLVWLGGSVLVAIYLAVTSNSVTAAEVAQGALTGLIILALLTLLSFARGFF